MVMKIAIAVEYIQVLNHNFFAVLIIIPRCACASEVYGSWCQVSGSAHEIQVLLRTDMHMMSYFLGFKIVRFFR